MGCESDLSGRGWEPKSDFIAVTYRNPTPRLGQVSRSVMHRHTIAGARAAADQHTPSSPFPSQKCTHTARRSRKVSRAQGDPHLVGLSRPLLVVKGTTEAGQALVSLLTCQKHNHGEGSPACRTPKTPPG